MSSTRYDWWGYCKGMIRRYPQMQAELEALQAPNMTAAYDAITVSGGGIGNPTANKAFKRLPGNRGREYDAVTDAINATMRDKNGLERIRLIEIVFWKKTHTLMGAAQVCHVSERSARRWHTEFIRLVAKNYGLLD